MSLIVCIISVVYSLGGAAGEVFQCVDTMEEIKKNEHVSIQDLHPFISISNEQVTQGSNIF